MNYEARYNETQTHVTWQAVQDEARVTPRKHEASIVLNRAQRRTLARYIRRKAAPSRRIQRRRRALMHCCPRCQGPFFVPEQVRALPILRLVQDRQNKLYADYWLEVAMPVQRCQCPALKGRA